MRSLGIRHALLQFARHSRLRFVLQPHEWRRRVDVQRVGLQPVLVDAAEHRGKRIEVARRDRVVLVVVAARAFEREPQERGPQGRHTICDPLLPKLLGNRAALFGHAMQSPKRSRDAIVDRRVFAKVACCDAFDELVVRHVAAQRAQQPIAPRPRAHLAVGLVAVGVRVARKVKPRRRHVLRRGVAVEHRSHETFVLRARRIGRERIGVFRLRRQSRQRERRTAQQRSRLGARRRTRAARFELREHERIEWIDWPLRVVDVGHFGGNRRHKRPMRRIAAALLDPTLQRSLLVLRQRPLELGRRHHVVFVVREDALHEFTRVHVAGRDRNGAGLQRRARALFDIEPQSSLARSFVRPVARKAAIRKDRPHIATEVDALRIARSIAAIPTRACDCDGDGSEQRDGGLHRRRTIARGRRADAAPRLTRARAGRRP